MRLRNYIYGKIMVNPVLFVRVPCALSLIFTKKLTVYHIYLNMRNVMPVPSLRIYHNCLDGSCWLIFLNLSRKIKNFIPSTLYSQMVPFKLCLNGKLGGR